MNCPECKQEMTKTSVLESANIRFQNYKCSSCYVEKSEALGIINMPEQ